MRVRTIRQLLDVGLTLDDARVFLPCLDGDVTAGPASEKGLRVAADRLAVLEARIAAQVAVRDRLATALRPAGVSAHAPAAAPPHQATAALARTVA
ncbi:DNA-binding transcriptional MerR regulator [Streptomyces sp. AK010]|nr:DNA-binding transcriptional MerR regulator [Streptomyces sp. AK010]